MKVTQLRLHGFKSFVDAVDVPIERGVTGIVGPNGCGKSNLVEALRFVMGESSYKAMRGGGMEDVIFSGSAGRPARNMAEVTLVTERDEGRGAGPEALEIARRIERDSGSSYRINGREARARDVQILFADAATGAHSAALVRQGQISEIIAAKPEKRRGILEDAAGISGLHARRNEAEQKLKAAEQNLARLDDVMSEIGVNLEGLRRQARQAIRYRKISGDIRKLEATLYAVNWEATLARLAQAEAELGDARAAFAAAKVAQEELAEGEAAAAALLPALREKASLAAAALERLRNAANELAREEAQLKARREELISRRGEAAADLQHEIEIGSDATATNARLDDEEARLRKETAESAELIAEARRAAENAAAAVTAREAEFSAVAGALAAAAAERAQRERAMREAQAKLRRLEDERKAVLQQRERIDAEHGSDADLNAARSAAGEAEAFLVRREKEAEDAEAALAAARGSEQEARAPSETAERRLAALEAEARTLTKLLDAERTGRFAPLIDSVEVTAGYEKALAAALGDDLDASLDSDAPAFWGPSESGESDPPLPEGTEPLAAFVRAPERLDRRLRQIGMVAAEDAERIALRLVLGQRLVTREGGLWRWDGFRVESGSVAAGAGRLEQRSRLGAVVAEMEEARQEASATSGIFTKASNRRAEAERADSLARAGVLQIRKALDQSRAALAEAERKQARIAERLSAYAGALARIDADNDASRAELRTATNALEALPDIAVLEGRRDAVQASLARDRGVAAESRLEAERAAHEETLRMRRVAEIAAERERGLARIRRAEERVAEFRERLKALDAAIAAVPDDPHYFEGRRQSLSAETAAAEEAERGASVGLADAEAAHVAARNAARAALDALSEAREIRGRDEERVIAAGSRKTELAAQAAEHFGRPVEELRGLAEIAPDADLPEAEATETRLHKLKAERERLGGVNLRAEEEANELEARLDGMRAEHGDLEEAIKRLRQGIQSLNREGRERLLAAFDTVNAHFSSLFKHLFGGGTAELALTGSDDPLEAGLEIVARPPGKRPQTMTLLSGGEQALTALALIFAVFLTNPSPICVLDEVDAPLDDANVERFCALLDDMRKRTETRFVVVTHNPITMARMDRLFGVTMAERGVSQIVSVDLETAEGFREAS